MNKFKAHRLIAGLSVAFIGWMIGGCDGRDECERATDHLSTCLQIDLSNDISDDRFSACASGKLRWSRCINDADCEAIENAFRPGKLTAVSQELRDCISFLE